MLEIVHTRVFKTWIENGICHTVVSPASGININDAKENTRVVAQLSAGTLYPLLVDLCDIHSISKEARDHFAMRDRKPGVNAIAMIVKSPVSSIIGNFFLGLNKPSVPTQLFVSKEKATNWLQQYIPDKND
jgi:hypothetical protein